MIKNYILFDTDLFTTNYVEKKGLYRTHFYTI